MPQSYVEACKLVALAASFRLLYLPERSHRLSDSSAVSAQADYTLPHKMTSAPAAPQIARQTLVGSPMPLPAQHQLPEACWQRWWLCCGLKTEAQLRSDALVTSPVPHPLPGRGSAHSVPQVGVSVGPALAASLLPWPGRWHMMLQLVLQDLGLRTGTRWGSRKVLACEAQMLPNSCLVWMRAAAAASTI